MSDMAPPPAPAPMAGPSSNAKLIALLGWIFAPLGIIAVFLDDYKNDMFVRSHVIQAAAFWIAVQIIGWLTSFLLGLGFIIMIVGFVYQVIMALKANKGETTEVPVIWGIVKSYVEQTS
jgi:uncharacterized membrane protein